MNNKNKLTISDIAKLAETSKTTISFYLNGRFDKMSEATKQRIEKVIESNHYTPNYAARMLNLKHSRTIGVIIGDITNGFSNQMVKGISERANENKYQLVIGNSNYQNDEEYAYICNMLSMGVDGFIIQPTHQF
ncbi:MAG: LacI family DNA-binding transcriptional regulator, partial [Erysipelotrichaceae bacterium]